MSTDALRERVEDAVRAFEDGPLGERAAALLKCLGYESERTLGTGPENPRDFLDQFVRHSEQTMAERQRSLILDTWKRVEIVFQYGEDELASRIQGHLFENQFTHFDESRIKSFLFMAVELRDGDHARFRLASMVRGVNRLFRMPVIVFFRYRRDDGTTALTLAVIHRRAHKRDFDRDVLTKATLIKDIRVDAPHSAHVRIPSELALAELAPANSNFDELHRAWQQVLDTEELNRRFYKRLYRWFECAVDDCSFPDDGAGAGNAERHVIRMITRLLFIWFLKEKWLVPGELFRERFAEATLTNHGPERTDYYRAVLQNLFFATLNTELGKVDPQNERWKRRQLDAAEAIEDPQARGSALRAIEHAFSEERCYGDFGRKLYLIQRVIHGVDIQPVATQITKLRFFISLIVEQQPTSDPANNYGLDPLPNLETNFIAANSLLGMERPAQAELRSTEVSRLEERLKRLRRQWFDAHDRGAKWELRKKDERLRGELREALIEDEWSETAANALSAWRPYDQNASADWLDPEWMFGVKDGFDVVIGNPPYVRADFPDPAHQELRQRVVDSDRYETLWEKWDLYIPFIERGFRLLREGGVITFIVSDAYCHAKYAEKSQEWFLRHARILRLDFLSRIRIFDAAVRNVTFVFQKTNGVQNKPQRRVHHGEFGNVKLLTTDEQRRLTHRAFFPEDTIEHRFSRPTVTLDEVGYVSVGLVAHADEKRVPGAFQLADLVSDTPDAEHPWGSYRGTACAEFATGPSSVRRDIATRSLAGRTCPGAKTSRRQAPVSRSSSCSVS